MTQEAFEERIVSLSAMLYYVSFSLLPGHADREDAVQECLHKALVRRHQLRDETQLKPWLTRILVNECHNIIRRKRREQPMESVVAPAAPEAADPWLYEGVMGLPEKLRVPFVLHYLQGYTIRETAQALRAPQSTVKSRLSRARALLAGEMEGEAMMHE